MCGGTCDVPGRQHSHKKLALIHRGVFMISSGKARAASLLQNHGMKKLHSYH